MVELIPGLLVAFLPVTLFLVGLLYLDSYKLVPLRTILIAIAAGGCAAVLSYYAAMVLLPGLALNLTLYSRYVAPYIEESLKGLILVYFIRTHRIGFLVDAAIFGFAIGAGFALFENAFYLGTWSDRHIAVWIIRGFGTALMHGGATAVLGIVSMVLAERRASRGPLTFLPGIVIATVLHSLYNHSYFGPVNSALAVLLLLPPFILFVFKRSEQSMEDWLGVGFDADTELLALMQSGQLSESRVGRYLQSVKEHFSREVIVDLLCYLRLHVELSLRAKGELMMRESGFRTPLDAEIKAKFEELKFLEKSIGPTGKLAILPFLHISEKDLWQFYMLESG